MVNLIITLISIALIAAVAVAALYNGGDAFRQGSAKSSAAQLVNAGQQVSAANVLYANDNGGTYASSLSDLTDNGAYLSSEPRVPENFSISDITDNEIEIGATETSDEICNAVNDQAGLDSIPTDETGISSFGCYQDGTSGNATFVFK